MAKDLLDVPKLLDEIERDTGIFFEGGIDCRHIYICPMHPGAQELPYHPKEHLKSRRRRPAGSRRGEIGGDGARS